MSAFNDYCIVCGQMIDAEARAVDTEHDRLYCSSQCQEHDRVNTENLKLSNELAGTPASLIRSPLLQPVDNSQGRVGSGIGANGREAEDPDMDFDLEVSLDGALSGDYLPLMTIPRSSITDCLNDTFNRSAANAESFMSRQNVLSDHTAADNYKLWLNYNLAN